MHGKPSHNEYHFTGNERLRDIVIGMADGLTVPFALAAGLSGAVLGNKVIVTAGLAEIAAGTIAMGLGGFLAARGDEEHYKSERIREEMEVVSYPELEKKEVAEVFESYGLTSEESTPIVESLSKRPSAWVDFMMRFELGLEEPHPGRAWQSAFTIGTSYAVGGLFPLGPYMISPDPQLAFYWSIGLTTVALTVFGYCKGRFSGARPWRSMLETVLTGATAASAAFLIAKSIR